MLMLLKARVAAYTKKDGTFVAEHHDKRPGAKPKQLALVMREPTGGDQVVALPYASGMSRKRDMAAAIESPAGLGTVVQELSDAGMDRIADAVAAGKPVFVDSGAFPAFKAAMKAGKPEEARLDFEKVFAKYNELSRRVRSKVPDFQRNSLLMLVAPDVVGDQVATLELVEQHREQIAQWIEAGHEVIVPFQRGPVRQYLAYLRVKDALEDLPFVVGIPSAAAAMSTEDVVDLVSHDYKPDRIHILGAVQSKRYEDRMQVIRDHYVDDVPGVTTDANVMRSKLHELGGLSGEVKFEQIKDILTRVVPEHYGGTRLAKGGIEVVTGLVKTLVHEHTRKDGVHVGSYERKPMYVSRKVLNGQAVHDWAKRAGFQNVVPPDKMHVTVAYSKTPVHHGSVDPNQETVAAKPKHVGRLGDGTDHVLHVDHPKLQERFKHMLSLGASWDHDARNYQPHVTISYKPQERDFTGIPPFEDAIELGPEVVEDLKTGWGKEVTEQAAAAPAPAEDAFEDDMTRQAAWLDGRAKEKGFNGVEDLLMQDPALFSQLAASWRDEHPALAKALDALAARASRRPVLLLLKAKSRGDTQTPDMFGTHVEQRVRKDGVTQKYHVATSKPRPPANGHEYGNFFHGTPLPFDKFRDPREAKDRGAGYDHQGSAVYLTSDPHGYGRFFARASGAKLALRLSAQGKKEESDAVADGSGHILSVKMAEDARILKMAEAPKDIRELFDRSVGDKAVGAKLREAVLDAGYDGIAFDEPNYPEGWELAHDARTVVLYDQSKAIVTGHKGADEYKLPSGWSDKAREAAAPAPAPKPKRRDKTQELPESFNARWRVALGAHRGGEVGQLLGYEDTPEGPRVRMRFDDGEEQLYTPHQLFSAPAAAKPAAPPAADPAEDDDHPAPLPRRSLAALSDDDRAKWIRLHRTQHETHYHELGKVRDEMDRVRSKRNKAQTAMREAETGLAGQQRAPIPDPGRESLFSAAVGANRAEFDKHARKLDELAGHHESLSKLRDGLGRQKDELLPGSGDLRSNLMSGQRSSLREELDAQKQFGKQYRDYFKTRGRKKK